MSHPGATGLILGVPKNLLTDNLLLRIIDGTD